MNINIYLEDSLADSLNHYVKDSGQSRNAIIREAVQEYLTTHQVKNWPESVLQHKGIKGVAPFESHRKELIPPKEDPLE